MFKKHDGGYFLLETLVAVMILGVASATFLAMHLAAARHLLMAEKHTTAAALAREKMEQVISAGFSRAADTGEPEVAGFPAFAREVRVTLPEWAEGLKLRRVEVRVSWAREDNSRSEYRLASYLAAR